MKHLVEIVILLSVGVAASAGDVTVRPAQSEQGGTFDSVLISGLPAGLLKELQAETPAAAVWRERFPVKVVAETSEPQPAMLGKYRVVGEVLIFEPRFPLVPGVAYRAAWPGSGGAAANGDFALPKLEQRSSARVLQVYPTGETLPENQLKFYIYFSAPMSRGQAYQRIQLFKESGAEVPDPFLTLGEELWDGEGVRFTLLFDPGRIKRGLKPREEVGPVLEEGQRYTLVVHREWEDANGAPLTAGFAKKFSAGPPDDVQPDIEQWKIVPPKALSREALLLRFDEPLDRAMLERVIRVQSAAGGFVEGTVHIDRQETEWRFTPAQPWSAGEYTLAVDAALEDRGGNSLAKPFEVDIFRRVERAVERKTATRKFRIDAE